MRQHVHNYAAVAVLALSICLAPRADAKPCPASQHPTFKISVAPGLTSEPLSGRLIVLMTSGPIQHERLAPSFGPDAHSVWVAAKDVHGLTAEQPVTLDPDDLAYPDAFCNAPAGAYKIKSVLDVNHDFAYRYNSSGGDLESAITEQSFNPAAGDVISVTLSTRKSEPPQPQIPPRTELFDFVSPALSQFWGRPIHMLGAVVLPPSYVGGKERYPTAFVTHGFGGDMNSLLQRNAANMVKLTDTKKIPEMIWVMLLEASPTGTHEFADSVNNGPWGKALRTELIPFLEKKYRMDAKPSGRLLTGHSSGGWATLWLQVAYPSFFGGTWPTSPDPGDFRSFTRIDITKAPLPNFYRDENGAARMFVLMGGKDTQSIEDLARQERVLGDYGGQLASFEWVFSPRGKDGRPMALFNRDTGAIDPDVAAYWEAHYDIASILRTNWKKIGPSVNGKIHVTVGTADTFHLEEPAHLLEQTIHDLGGQATFTYMDGRSHFDLYQGDLAERIANEMYAVARPGGRGSKQSAGAKAAKKTETQN
jgi:hypothetical protein